MAKKKVFKIKNDEFIDSSSVMYNRVPLNKALNCSLDETIIGSWKGKPLYQKIIEINNLTYGQIINYEHNISNVEFAFPQNILGLLNDTTVRPLMMLINENLNYDILFQIDRYYVIYKLGNSMGFIKKLLVVLNYTKTTDKLIV